MPPIVTLPHTDIELMRLRLGLTPGQRIQAMLDARDFIVGGIRGRLRSQYPDLSDPELNLKVLEEIDRAKRLSRRPVVLLPGNA